MYIVLNIVVSSKIRLKTISSRVLEYFLKGTNYLW